MTDEKNVTNELILLSIIRRLEAENTDLAGVIKAMDKKLRSINNWLAIQDEKHNDILITLEKVERILN